MRPLAPSQRWGQSAILSMTDVCVINLIAQQHLHKALKTTMNDLPAGPLCLRRFDQYNHYLFYHAMNIQPKHEYGSCRSCIASLTSKLSNR